MNPYSELTTADEGSTSTDIPLNTKETFTAPSTTFANDGHIPSNLHIALGPKSTKLRCPHCFKVMKTKIWKEHQKSAHIAACVLCWCLCWTCFFIPYLMNAFKDVHHKCPECKGFIGTFRH